jgi:hypothetical protein
MTFVEKEFYHEPPATQDKAAWEEWMLREKRSRAAHKAAHTRTLAVDMESYETMFPSGGATVKIDGVWKQQDSFIGFSGSAEDGTTQMEAVMPEQQEKIMALARMEESRNTRGRKSRNRNARRRKNRKAKKNPN